MVQEDKDRKQLLTTAEMFLSSMRGRYIIAQALHYGINALESVKGAWREVSNINDMKYLRDEIFNFPIMFDEHNRLDEPTAPKDSRLIDLMLKMKRADEEKAKAERKKLEQEASSND